MSKVLFLNYLADTALRSELADLQTRMLEMGGLVEAAIRTSLLWLVEGQEPPAKEIWER